MNISKREAGYLLALLLSEADADAESRHLPEASANDRAALAYRLDAYLNQCPRELEAVAVARNRTTDDLEIDDEPATSLSEQVGGDTGCWVAAWMYVSPEELEDSDDN